MSSSAGCWLTVFSLQGFTDAEAGEQSMKLGLYVSVISSSL